MQTYHILEFCRISSDISGKCDDKSRSGKEEKEKEDLYKNNDSKLRLGNFKITDKVS